MNFFVLNLVLPETCYRSPLTWFYDLTFKQQFEPVMKTWMNANNKMHVRKTPLKIYSSSIK